ncbi:MAG: ABC transporter ATP-binding protein [Bacteroidetes bacterium]|nr:MAG: ABC transporter ATP-binding protein [Bacteroidota bacterium]
MDLTPELTPLRRFLRLLSVDKQEVISIYIYAIFNGLINLSLPLGIQAIINLIMGGELSTAWMVMVAVVILGIAISGVLQVMQLSVTENVQQKIFVRSAFEFAYRIPRMKLEAVNKFYLPEMVNRFFDTLSVQKGISKILMDFFTASFQMIFGLILLSFYHPFFIVFGLILLIVLYLIIRFMGPRGMRTSLKESYYKYRVAYWLEELGRTMETFKLAGQSDMPLKKTDEVVTGYLDARKKHFMVLVQQFMNLIGFKVIVAAGLLIIGSLLVFQQQMNIGQFVAAEIIIILVIAAIEKLIMSIETIYDVLTAIEKIGSVTDIELENSQGMDWNGEHKPQAAGLHIKLKNLSYHFHDTGDKVLDKVDLELMPGERVCVTGPNGSGKSMLLQIIAGLYEQYEGSLSYNHIPLRNLELEKLRACIGTNLKQQDLFNGSIYDNICMGRPGIATAEVKRAIEQVGLTEYIEALPDGYFTIIHSEGRRLPRGIVARLLLARAVVRAPRLILLEDTLDLLEAHERQRFLSYLLHPSKNWTVLAISNDPEVISLFDRALVMSNGRITADSRLMGQQRPGQLQSNENTSQP